MATVHDTGNGTTIVKDGKTTFIARVDGNSKVIPIRKTAPKRKSKLREWLSSKQFYTTAKIILLLVIAGLVGFGSVAYAMDAMHDAARIWMAAFFCMLFVWRIEYKIRMNFDHIKPSK